MDKQDFEDEFEDSEPANISGRFGMGGVRLALTRWWIMLVFALVGYLVALYFLSVTPPSHEATAVLEVVTKKQQLVGPELEKSKIGINQEVVTLANKILSPTQLRSVAANPDVQALERVLLPETNWKPLFWRTEEELEYKPASSVSNGKLAAEIAEWVTVTPRVDTSLLDIKVSHPDSEAALVIANAVLAEYMLVEKARKKEGRKEALESLRAEIAEASDAIEQAEQSLQLYKKSLSISAELTARQEVLSNLSLKYKPKHPRMMLAVGLYNNLAKRFEREINVLLKIPSEQGYWLPKKEELDELKLVQTSSSLGANNEWVSLAQNYLTARASLLNSRTANEQNRYNATTQRLSEIDVDQEKQDADLIIAQEAYSSGSVETERILILSQGLGGGVLLGFALAYLLGVLDYKVYDVRSVEESTGLSCLAAVPASDVFEDQENWEPVLIREPSSANSESIRNLRASVVLLGKQDRHRTIVMTSPAPGEGKTTASCELAASFAMSHEKVCLVDFDLRKPRVHQLFPGLKDKTGTAEVLAGQAELKEVIRQTEVENLFVIGSGAKVSNPAELLQKDEIEDLFNVLSSQFDRVIIDCPPVLPVSDTRLLGNLAQSVILVVRARRTPVGAVLRAIQLLTESKARVVGFVLNGMSKKQNSGKYYGYKGYGEYGKGYDYYGNDN